MAFGNAVARLVPPAAFAALAGAHGISPGMIGTAYLSGETSSAYHSTRAETLKRYDKMSLDELMQDDYFRPWYQLYSQGNLDSLSLEQAKKEAASRRAADEAGLQIILNLATQKMDKLVPEESPSAALEFARSLAKSGAIEWLGKSFRRMMEMGKVIDEGHGW